MTNFIYSNELYHHGIKGQRWGIRRYQNADGTLTAKGRARYYKKELNKADSEAASAVAGLAGYERPASKYARRMNKYEEGSRRYNRAKKKYEKLNVKMSELATKYVNSVTKGQELIKQLEADGELVYRTSPAMWSNKTDIWNPFSSGSYYQTVWGTRYSVKTATDKRKNSKRWTKDRGKYNYVPVRTNYYYV